jgi:hypothetical protein
MVDLEEIMSLRRCYLQTSKRVVIRNVQTNDSTVPRRILPGETSMSMRAKDGQTYDL